MNYSGHRPIRDSLAKIDEALRRSRQVVQDSLELNKRPSSQKPRAFESSPYTTPVQYNLPLMRQSSPVASYEEQIFELTEKLHTEQLLKTNYENALKDLRDRLSEIEHKESTKAEQHDRLITEQKLAFERREQFLLEKIDQMERVNRQLLVTSNHSQTPTPEQSRPKTSQRLKQLEAEVHKYKRLAEQVPKLENELEALKAKHHMETQHTQDLEAKLNHHTDFEKQTQDNTAKLAQIERQLRQTAQKYSALAEVLVPKRRKVAKSQPRTPLNKSAVSKRASACHSPFGRPRTRKS